MADSMLLIRIDSCRWKCMGNKFPSIIRRIARDSPAICRLLPENGEIEIGGEESAMKTAANLINTALTDRIDTFKVHRMFGEQLQREGELTAIEKQTGARITLSDHAAMELEGSIQGSDSQVECARRQLINYERHHSLRCITGLEAWQRKAVLGRHGSSIGSIEAKSGASINMLDAVITISGSEEQVELGWRLIELILNDTKRAVVPIPTSKRRLVLGRGGCRLNAIRSTTGALIDIDDGFATISGTDTQVKDALASMQDAIDSEIERSVSVDAEMIGLVIGRSGARVKGIEAESGAKISMDEVSHSSSDVVIHLSGTPDNVACARALIRDVLDSQMLEKVHVDDDKIWNMLVMRGVGVLMNIAVLVRMSLRTDSHTIVVYGEPAEVRSDLIKLHAALDSWRSIDIVLPEDQIRCVIGKRGTRVQAIERDTGAILIATKGSPILTIFGTSTTISAAKGIVEQCTDSEHIEMMSVAENMMGSLVGKAGSIVMGIEKVSGARIIVNRDTQQVSIKGLVDERVAAIAAINSIIDSTVITESIAMTELIHLPGIDDSIVEMIQRDTGATIVVDASLNSCRLHGTYAAVNQAKIAINDLRSRLRTFRCDIDAASHNAENVIVALLGPAHDRIAPFEASHNVRVVVRPTDSFYDPTYTITMGGITASDDEWTKKVNALGDLLSEASLRADNLSS